MNLLTPRDYKKVIAYTEQSSEMTKDQITTFMLKRCDSVKFLALDENDFLTKPHLVNNLVIDGSRAINLHYVDNWDITLFNLVDKDSRSIETIVRVVLFSEGFPVSFLSLLEMDFIRLFSIMAYKSSFQFQQYIQLN